MLSLMKLANEVIWDDTKDLRTDWLNNAGTVKMIKRRDIWLRIQVIEIVSSLSMSCEPSKV